jgi:beta-carotene ketolase (CrtW type)
VAAAIVGLWIGVMSAALFGLPLDVRHLPLGLALVPVVTFLFSGLFITAHDAIHGLVAPAWPRLNRAVGTLCVGLYAGFSYGWLRTEHQIHHRTPASAEDPDYHDGHNAGFWAWYFHFMRHYVTLGQLVRVGLVFNSLRYLAGAPLANLLFLWMLPAILSSLQLFYFGTYLPHRAPPGGYRDEHRAESNNYGVWFSFLTCYHFGYHHEHHAQPHLPWWKLPSARWASG